MSMHERDTMTDALLDEATRYGERFKNVPVGTMVLALVERIRELEGERAASDG